MNKLDRSELSRQAWRKHREKLMAGARKAGETRKKRYPKKKVIWVCKDKSCQMQVLASKRPEPRTWASGHTCRYVLKKMDKK